jgi:hypothetical protein
MAFHTVILRVSSKMRFSDICSQLHDSSCWIWKSPRTTTHEENEYQMVVLSLRTLTVVLKGRRSRLVMLTFEDSLKASTPYLARLQYQAYLI